MMTQKYSPKRLVWRTIKQFSNLKNLGDKTRPVSLVVISLFMTVFLTLEPGKANAGSEFESTLDKSIQAALTQANLVLVGEIIGLVDTKPGAQLRRSREVHRVRVMTTLKGEDLTGRELIVRPASISWPDGEQHVLFLVRSGEPFAQAIDTTPMPADRENIRALRTLIAARDEGVEPAPLLEAEVVEGWSIEPSAILNVDVNGWLSWNSTMDEEPGPRVSAVSIDRVEAFIQRVRTATPGPLTDDGSMLRIRWQDATGKEQTAVFNLTDEGIGTLLLDAIRDLVRSSE
jgi:hypothetical protein